MNRLFRCFYHCLILFIGILLFIFPEHSKAYPLDAYPETDLRRVEAARLAVLGLARGRAQPPGALLPTNLVDLRLLDRQDVVVPEADQQFTTEMVRLLKKPTSRYGLAVLDLSDPDNPRFAEHRADIRQNVGSVGKIVAALAIFQALADIYPDDLEQRKQILRETIITADKFIIYDEHEVRLWNPETGTLKHRRLLLGDQGSLWEYLDWALSASSNAAAAMVMKNAMLLRHFGREYPLPDDQVKDFFKKTPRKELRTLFERTFLEAITRNGLNLRSFRQGSFFTRSGKQKVPTGYSSYGTARELLQFLLFMEQGKLVDTFSSREIKRLLYMTERRIRYASSPALSDSAVYFKSGSLYSCEEEVGFVCEKYHGNVRNYMNSIAVVETPAGINRLFYITVLISNVLYENSAVEHQSLATFIHRLIEADHPPPPTPVGEMPAEVNFVRNLIDFEHKQQSRLQAADIQMALSALGYKVGPIDGVVGRKTRKAIRSFQKFHRLKVDGKSTAELRERLQAAVEAHAEPSQQ